IFIRENDHPVLKSLVPLEKRGDFQFLLIERYYPTLPKFRWDPTLSREEELKELITLPNQRPLDDYKAEAQELLNQIPKDEPEFEKYPGRLKIYRDLIRKALEGQPDETYKLGEAIDRMLNDQGERDPKADKDQPKLVDFWAQDAMKTLRARFDTFRKGVLY